MKIIIEKNNCSLLVYRYTRKVADFNFMTVGNISGSSLNEIPRVSIKASYRRSTAPVGPLTAVCLDAQNAGNRISELLDFKFPRGGGGSCLQTPLGERGLAAPSVFTAAYYTFRGRL